MANSKEETKEKDVPKYVPVQEYTGQGFRLRNHNDEVDQLADEHKSEITAAVKQFMLENYHTDVTVHNLVGANNYVSVFFEAEGELTYYSYVNVPVDLKQEKFFLDHIDSLEGVIEISITSAIYQRIFEKEFKNLDEYVEEAADKNDLVGITEETLKKVSGRGYGTPFYFVSSAGGELDLLYQSFMERQGKGLEELLDSIGEKNLNDVYASIVIILFMEEANVEPNQDAFNLIVKDIKRKQAIPPGEYTIIVNDNDISTKYGLGTKDNQLIKGDPDPIIKE